jgi:OmpA-OmpF porin, OOP family
MKDVSVILLVVSSLLLAGMAEAAPKKRTRNANRVGPYAGALISQTSYTGDQNINEQQVINYLEQQGVTFDNVTTETEDTDIGYEAIFGYRFNRYIAGEFGLLQVGDLTNTIRGDYDAGTGAGIVPASVSFKYNFGGPIIAVVGILPLGDKFELYGRAGVLFASADRDATARIDGDGQQLGGIKGDSTEVVYGIGASFHINVMYSIRAEYMRFDEVGDPSTTGTEDLNNISIGLTVRF